MLYTNGWYSMYQRLVFDVPMVGTSRTNRLVFCVLKCGTPFTKICNVLLFPPEWGVLSA